MCVCGRVCVCMCERFGMTVYVSLCVLEGHEASSKLG